MIGTVVKWDDSRGYGFIDTETRKNIFVHYSAIVTEGFKSLTVGQRVSFDLYDKPKGVEALNVVKL